MIQLARAGFEQRQAAVVTNATLIAEAILFGARDRGTGKFVRSLFDQQQRSKPLQQARPARPRPPRLVRSPRVRGKSRKASA